MKYFILLSFLVAELEVRAQIVNGDFESPAIAQNSATRIIPGGGELTGWSVSGGDVGLLDYPQSSANGSQFLHLLGENEALIMQNFETIPDQLYQVTFGYSEASFLAPFVGMDVLWNHNVIASFYAEPASAQDSFWKNGAVTVQGTGADSIGFRSKMSGSEGYYLDNVQMVPIPEPGESKLLTAAALAALAASGVRRTSVKLREPGANVAG